MKGLPLTINVHGTRRKHAGHVQVNVAVRVLGHAPVDDGRRPVRLRLEGGVQRLALATIIIIIIVVVVVVVIIAVAVRAMFAWSTG